MTVSSLVLIPKAALDVNVILDLFYKETERVVKMSTSVTSEAIFVMTFVRIPRVVSPVTAGQGSD